MTNSQNSHTGVSTYFWPDTVPMTLSESVLLTLNLLNETLLGFVEVLFYRNLTGSSELKRIFHPAAAERINQSLQTDPAVVSSHSCRHPAAAAATCRRTAVLLLCDTTEVTDNDLYICLQHLYIMILHFEQV